MQPELWPGGELCAQLGSGVKGMGLPFRPSVHREENPLRMVPLHVWGRGRQAEPPPLDAFCATLSRDRYSLLALELGQREQGTTRPGVTTPSLFTATLAA